MSLQSKKITNTHTDQQTADVDQFTDDDILAVYRHVQTDTMRELHHAGFGYVPRMSLPLDYEWMSTIFQRLREVLEITTPNQVIRITPHVVAQTMDVVHQDAVRELLDRGVDVSGEWHSKLYCNERLQMKTTQDIVKAFRCTYELS